MSSTRREILLLGGAAAAGLCVPGVARAAAFPPRDPNAHRIVYRRSSRGRRACKAVKIVNANLRFKHRKDALRYRVHPGDTSKVVPIEVSIATFLLWFPQGRKVVDVRTLNRG